MTDMKNYILDVYIPKRCGICGAEAASEEEQRELERGIDLYLRKNGIGPVTDSPYYIHYVENNLRVVDEHDLKRYFFFYPEITCVRKIVRTYERTGYATAEMAVQMLEPLRKLEEGGLGMRYVPEDEVRLILESLYAETP